MSDHKGLEELFSRLRAPSSNLATAQPPSSDSIWAHQQQQSYEKPSVSSPIFSPPAQTPNPIHSSNIISPANPSSNIGTPNPDLNRTNNLLNLLRSNSQGGQASPMASLQNVAGTRGGSHHLQGQGRPPSAQDVMASFQPKVSAANVLSSPMTAAGAEKGEPAISAPSSSKDFLLNLLNKPKEQQAPQVNTESQAGIIKKEETDKDEAAIDRLAQSFAQASVKQAAQTQPPRESTPIRYFGSADSSKTPMEAPQPTKASKFNYVNPFDQLHSSSPLNRSPKPDAQPEAKEFEILKHNRDAPSALHDEPNAPAAKSRKITSKEGSPAASPAPAGMEKGQSVSQAMEGVGEKVNLQVEQALARADAQEMGQAGDNRIDGQAHVNKENTADEDVESSWESAEDEEAQKKDERKIEVYNFPMKPFVSIQINKLDTARPINYDNFMMIAQLKKEFDQIDRCLVTASQTYIVYAQVATKKDKGGFRIIRQDTGDDKSVFKSSGERIFSVQLCDSAVADNDLETVLGAGVNGSVFWTSLAKSRGELFKDDDIEVQGFIMPPVATPEEQTSGSPVKTRAKMSSRHPQYFGVARGKEIHIIAPDTVKSKAYCDQKTRKINSEKYLAEHSLKIVTGKAGKDFCFSEDDTMIVTLDKVGRFKFWDIRDLTSRASDISEGKHEPVELREPMWSLTAAASGSKPDEKPSVSSIMFLDKERPTLKGVALRYMVIGFKQNHILQLWDLGLGKAVQEIRLPHEKESDGICSITYHPRSGIIALGHPTRNSIYFIHLSAPKYNVSHMDQAKYINLLARGDPSLPRPESTAIMSGLREFSFSRHGQLRSLDMLRQPVENASDPDSDDATLFELYVYHSQGVVGVSIKRKDLGWDKDSKMVKPIDAVQAGIVDVRELIPSQRLPAPSEQTSNAEPPAKQTGKPAVNKKHEPVKPSTSTPTKSEVIKKEAALSPTPATNGSARSDAALDRSLKQVPTTPTPQPLASHPPTTVDSYAMAAQRAKSPAHDKALQDVENSAKKAPMSPQATAVAPPISSNDDLQTMLNKQFDGLYQRIDADKRVQDAAGSAKQDAMLRLVSSTLTENVEKSLKRIVSDGITKEVIPAISNSTTRAVEKKLSETLPQQLNTIMPREVEAALSVAIQRALKEPSVHNTIANQVASKVHGEVVKLLDQSMPKMATQATQKMMSDLEDRTKQQLGEADTRRQQDNAKIQELSNLVQSLSEMVQNMSESQTAFQEQILKMQRPSSKAGAREASSKDDEGSTGPVPPVDPQKEAEEQEVKKITQLLVDGEYDTATIAVSWSLSLLNARERILTCIYTVAPIKPPRRTLRRNLPARQSTLSRESDSSRRSLRLCGHHGITRKPRRAASRMARHCLG